MSIASKEAQERYPVGGDNGVSVESIIMDNDNGILQKAYVTGRTAEPTEAEIDAALPELLAAYRQESDIVTDRDYVKRILEAARKAVTG